MKTGFSAIRPMLAGALIFAPLGNAAAAQEIAYPNAEAKAMADCVALSTTGRDRLVTARWMAGSIGVASVMTDLVTVDEAKKAEADKQMGALFTRLFAEDCRDEARPLLAENDEAGALAMGGRLGQIAMRELMNDPLVTQSLSGYLKFIDGEAIAKAMEAE